MWRQPRWQKIASALHSVIEHQHVAASPLSRGTKVHQRSSHQPTRKYQLPKFTKFSMDPYNHTAGHWLQRDALQKRARHIQFDFAKLCDRVVTCCPGAKTVIDCQKREGGFNRSFIFSLDNQRKVVAKIPSLVAGPPRLTTSSEVATMEFGNCNKSQLAAY